MNLLPADPLERGHSGKRVRGLGRLRVVGGALLGGIALAVIGTDMHILNTRLHGARSERTRLEALIAEREGEEERLAAGRETLRQLRVTEGRLSRWDEERFLLSEFLRGLSTAVPDAVVLEEVRREGPDIQVTGRAKSTAAVARALDALSRMERVGDLELLWVEQVDGAAGAEEQRFALAGTLRYLSREPQPFDRVEAVAGTRETPR